ncbi:hypothetical protein Hte_006881 [Hypoxylon texense]
MATAPETKPAAATPRMRCQKCKEAFDNKHKLVIHQLKAGHLRCDICGDSFHTIESVSAHRTNIHKSPHNVVCPGCTSKFPTAGGWMHHVEKGECTSLFPSDVAGRAAEVMDQLGQEWRDRAKVESTPLSTKSHIHDTWDGYQDEADTPRFDVQKHPHGFPGIAKRDSHHSNSTGAGTGPLESRPGNAWSQKNLFPEKQEQKAVPPPSPLIENLTGRVPSSRPSGGLVLDPNSPGFNVAVFYNPILEVYTCPHKTCNTKCKADWALVAHLKSPKHTGIQFRCPSCNAPFTSTSSWIQHAETVAMSKCKIRASKQFPRIMREVSNGRLDVASIDEIFEEKVKVKLSEDWATQKQAATAESVPGSNQWIQSKQAQARNSESGSNV